MRDDPYSFVVSFVAFFVGQQLANLIGPYMLILVCALAGAQVALGRRDPNKKPAGWAFVSVVVAGAFAGTWIVSSIIAHYFSDSIGDPHTLFAPVAFIFGFVGLDWDEVLTWVLDRYMLLRGIPPKGQ